MAFHALVLVREPKSPLWLQKDPPEDLIPTTTDLTSYHSHTALLSA